MRGDSGVRCDGVLVCGVCGISDMLKSAHLCVVNDPSMSVPCCTVRERPSPS